MSKAAKSGPGIAPVLPAMGVHSYHNDRYVRVRHLDRPGTSRLLTLISPSPPFSGATELLGEPDHMSLGGSQGSLWNGDNGHPSASPNGASATPHFASKHLARGLTPPGLELTNEALAAELNELGLSESEPTSNVTPSFATEQGTNSGPVRPSNPRVPTSQDDVSLSSLRSRRLLSGYLFGNPQIPDDSATPTKQGGPKAADGGASPTAERRNVDFSLDVPQPPPTPSTVVSGQEEEIEAATLSPSTEAENIANDDALDGFQDGEADADDRATAVQAEHGGSQGYLRKEAGEAGEYRFPTHRLKRKMKGESRLSSTRVRV